ncbi:MAG: NYN domain-containing protein [Pseudomonadota bacterium]
MTRTIRRPRLAVLIDAENACAAHAARVMEKVREFGRPTVRWAYGDWTTTNLVPWKRIVSRLGIRPQQQFRYLKGKNTSDFALVMDAMHILGSRRVEGFCIVSSDSDYIGLAARIQEAGLLVYGFGNRTTMQDFVAACDEFVFVDEEEGGE